MQYLKGNVKKLSYVKERRRGLKRGGKILIGDMELAV